MPAKAAGCFDTGMPSLQIPQFCCEEWNRSWHRRYGELRLRRRPTERQRHERKWKTATLFSAFQWRQGVGEFEPVPWHWKQLDCGFTWCIGCGCSERGDLCVGKRGPKPGTINRVGEAYPYGLTVHNCRNARWTFGTCRTVLSRRGHSTKGFRRSIETGQAIACAAIVALTDLGRIAAKDGIPFRFNVSLLRRTDAGRPPNLVRFRGQQAPRPPVPIPRR